MDTLNKSEGVSLYVQIRETLRNQIKSGDFETGQKLSAEDELAAQFGVSRMTVRRSISDLVDEGLLYRRHGAGTFVAQPHVERDHNRLTNFFDTDQAQEIDVEVQLLQQEVVPARLLVANALALQETEPVIRINTLRRVDGIPTAVYDEYVPYLLNPDLLQEDLRYRPAWQVLESAGYKVKRAVQKIEARPADEILARLLDVEEDAPLLYKHRVVYLEDGTPVSLLLCHNRGDKYSVKMTLVR
jgi:GntR family transcriptional regulator